MAPEVGKKLKPGMVLSNVDGGTTRRWAVRTISYIAKATPRARAVGGYVGDGVSGWYALSLTRLSGPAQAGGPSPAGAWTMEIATAQSWGAALTVYKGWRVETNGFWAGTFALERFDADEGRWVVMRTFTSPESKSAGKNYSDSGEFDAPTRIRITSADFKPYVPSGNAEADRGYVVLTTTEATSVGVVRVKSVTSATSALVDVERELASTAPTRLWREGAWSDKYGWPQAAAFCQERLVLAGSTEQPQTVWFSRVGDYRDFGTSYPLQDDDAVTVTLAARQVNAVRFMIPLNDMVLLTSGSEWRLQPGAQKDAITPMSISLRPQGYRGVAAVEPLVVGNLVLFVQAQGSRVRDLGYAFDTDSYTGNDLTVMADHLIQGRRIVSWAYQQEPDTVCWIVRDDGTLLSLTYLKEHEVVAWARHPTAGKVEAVTSVRGPEGDEVYFVVSRKGGRFVERLTSPAVTTAKEGFFVDSGVTYRGTPTAKITGLGHLEGQTVKILADGSEEPNQVVSGGGVTLAVSASVVHVGLPYTSTLETLDLNVPRNDGTQLTRKLRVKAVRIRVKATRGLWAGSDEDHLMERFDRRAEPYGEPTELFTGDMHLTLESRYDSGRVVVTTRESALPASIQAIVPVVDVNG